MTSLTRGTPRTGRRVIVTGLAGSGKSTFSNALAARTGLPLVRLDVHFWTPNWVAPSDDDWRETQRRLLAGEAWIADGNYPESLDLRVGRADTIVVLAPPWFVCAGRAFLRGLHKRGEVPAGCEDSAWRRVRDEMLLVGRIWRKRRVEPELERRIIAEHGRHANVYVLRSKRAVSAFLDDL